MTSDPPLPRPVDMRRSPGDFDSTSGTTKVRTEKVSNRLELPVVALPGLGQMRAKGEDAPVFYAATMRATQRVVIGVGKNGECSARLRTLTAKPANEVS